jgi:dienelactone hydrolase
MALEAEGHHVHTPDLYDGEIFDDLQSGINKRDLLGIPELSRRASAAVEYLPDDLIYAGFSLGAACAQALALTRLGARGLVMMHAALPLSAFGMPAWPAQLQTQFHATTNDPWVDAMVVDTLQAAAPPGTFEVFRYPGEAHLFADDGYVDHDKEMASTMLERVKAFAASV